MFDMCYQLAPLSRQAHPNSDEAVHLRMYSTPSRCVCVCVRVRACVRACGVCTKSITLYFKTGILFTNPPTISTMHNASSKADHTYNERNGHYSTLILFPWPVITWQTQPCMACCRNTNLEFMRYCAIPTASGVPVMVTRRSWLSPSLPAILIWAPELTLRNIHIQNTLVQSELVVWPRK